MQSISNDIQWQMFKFIKSTATTSSEPKVTDKNLLGTQRGDPTVRKSENETNANSFTKKSIFRPTSPKKPLLVRQAPKNHVLFEKPQKTISRPTRKGKRKRKPKAEFVEVHAEIKEILICVFDEQVTHCFIHLDTYFFSRWKNEQKWLLIQVRQQNNM